MKGTGINLELAWPPYPAVFDPVSPYETPQASLNTSQCGGGAEKGCQVDC